MGAAERRQANQDMSSRMKREGVTRRTSRCCICGNIISTGARKDKDGKEIPPDTYTHVAMTCPGPARKMSHGSPTKVVKFKGPSKYNVRDVAYWNSGADFFAREAARYARS